MPINHLPKWVSEEATSYMWVEMTNGFTSLSICHSPKETGEFRQTLPDICNLYYFQDMGDMMPSKIYCSTLEVPPSIIGFHILSIFRHLLLGLWEPLRGKIPQTSCVCRLFSQN